VNSAPGPRRIAVAGVSGFLGSALAAALAERGDTVLGIGRSRPGSTVDIEWDPAAGRLDPRALEGVDAIANLTGANLGQRWTESVRKEIIESRVASTRLLATTIASMAQPPGTLLNMSAVGLYGDRGDEVLGDEAAPGSGFLAEVVRAWEAATTPAAAAGVRVVMPRLGVVIHPDSGPLQRLLPIFRLGAGGRIGDGRQWLTWIGRTDAIRVLVALLHRDDLAGPINACAPNPVRNEEFTKVLASVLHRPALAVVPPFAVRLLYGEMGIETVVQGQRVLPRRLLEAGFRFEYPDLRGAIEHELRT
jgi:uncharacterized protein (TIGR01777 family)